MGNRKHQHAQHVLGSKMAAKKDLMEMLWPVLGATLLFFIPYVLLSEALALACCGTGMIRSIFACPGCRAVSLHSNEKQPLRLCNFCPPLIRPFA